MTTIFLPWVSGGPLRLRVGTQNLGFDEAVRAASVAGDIARAAGLDVFAMQEVYRYPHGAEDHLPDLMADLRAGFPGWHVHEGPASTWMINVTVSRWPIVRAVTHIVEERHLLETTVQVGAQQLTIFNFHAKRDNDGQRHACRYTRAALEIIWLTAHEQPFLFVGDLNVTAARLWGECKAGAADLLQPSVAGYAGSDLWAGKWGPTVTGIEELGNVWGLQDAHGLTVASVEL